MTVDRVSDRDVARTLVFAASALMPTLLREKCALAAVDHPHHQRQNDTQQYARDNRKVQRKVSPAVNQVARKPATCRESTRQTDQHTRRDQNDSANDQKSSYTHPSIVTRNGAITR